MKLFWQKGKPDKLVADPPFCPACGMSLVERIETDGVYCGECGTLIHYHVAIMNDNDDCSMWVKCPICGDSSLTAPIIRVYNPKSKRTIENLCICDSYTGHGGGNSLRLHAPMGVCPVCWHKLAKNGTCINADCERYHKPEQARMVPMYETQTAAPHCANCGQPFVVLSPEAGNKEFAEIQRGLNGWIWISKNKGCSACGAAFNVKSA